MKISDKAKKELLNIISQDSDKILRVYLAGLG